MIISYIISHSKIGLETTVPELTGILVIWTTKVGLRREWNVTTVICFQVFALLTPNPSHTHPDLEVPIYTNSICTTVAWKEGTNIQSQCKAGFLDMRNQYILSSFQDNETYGKHFKFSSPFL